MLGDGLPLSAATGVLCRRWQPGVRLLPMSDDRVETQVILRDEGGRTVHFQEWWVRLHAAVPADGFVFAGADDAAPRRACWRPSTRPTWSCSLRRIPS
jgi:LPPG:FO 2-phospho-L-lactate transferase